MAKQVRPSRTTFRGETYSPGLPWIRCDLDRQGSQGHRFSPQGFSRRELNTGKDDGRLDAHSKSPVLDDTWRSLDHTIRFGAVGVGEFLLDAMLFAHLSEITAEKLPPLSDLFYLTF